MISFTPSFGMPAAPLALSYSSTDLDALLRSFLGRGSPFDLYNGFSSYGWSPSLGGVSSLIRTDSGQSAWVFSGEKTRDSTLGLSGAVLAGTQVAVYDGQTYLGQAKVSGGTWQFDTQSLAEGMHRLSVQFSKGMQKQTQQVVVTVDTHAEGSIHTQIWTPKGTTGGISSGGVTSERVLGLSGTAETGSQVQIFVDGVYQGNASVYGTQWRFNTTSLQDGTHQFSARIVDMAGNELQTQVISAKVETSQLGVVSRSMLTDNGLTSTIDSGGVTRDKTLGLSGTVVDGAKVQVFDGARLLGYGMVAGNSWTYTTTGLSEGRHALNIKYVLGNQSQSEQLIATIDTRVQGYINPQMLTDTGSKKYIQTGGVTADHTLGLTGSAEAGSVIQIYVDGTYQGNALLSGTQWKYTTQALSDGEHAFSAKITDAVGNTMTSQTLKATLLPVALGSVSSQLLTDAGLTATVASGGLTRDNTLGLKGTVVLGASVEVYDGETWLGQATVSGSNWSFTTPALPDGAHNLNVKFIQGLNTDTKKVSVTVDTVVTGGIDTFLRSDTGNAETVFDGGTTSDHTLGLSGWMEAGATVNIYQDGVYAGKATTANGQWHFITASLSDGAHTFEAQLTDAAGNQNKTSTVSVTVVPQTVTEPLPTHTWSDRSGWGSIDVLAAINQATSQNLADVRPATGVAWGIAEANINDAWSYGYTGKGVTVAVIDTGLDLLNTALNQRLSSWSYDFVNRDNDVSDDHGHGTFVSSEIVAAKGSAIGSGAAYDAELMVLKALDATGSGSASTICEAIYYAVDHGADVINLSLGGGDYVGYGNALQYARDHDVVVVMAAGNEGGAVPLDPAKYAQNFNNCLAVGALKNTSTGLAMATFSNLAGTGPYNFVDAAGQGVLGYTLNDQVQLWNGTSMATPYAAAAAALLLSANSSLHADQVLQYLTSTAHTVL